MNHFFTQLFKFILQLTLLGGIIKMICTSPLSSMALTAMLGLTGLPMGIAAVACFGGSFTNGMIFKRLHFGNNGNVIAVMLEPLTQADIVTTHPIPIYGSNFFGGGIAGFIGSIVFKKFDEGAKADGVEAVS